MSRRPACLVVCAMPFVAAASAAQPPATGARRFDRALALEDSGVTSATTSVGDMVGPM